MSLIVMLFCFLIIVMLTENFNLFNTYTDAQMLADVVADGSAIAGASPIGFNETSMADMANELIDANPIYGADVSYTIDAEHEYDNRGVPTNKELVTVEVEAEKDYFYPEYLSYNERFTVHTNAIVRVETPVAVNGVLSTSFMTNYRMTLPFVTSTTGHRNSSYVTWFVNYFLSPEYNNLYEIEYGVIKEEQLITDYMVCMGFDSFDSYQHGHQGWETYLSSSQAYSDGWFECNNLDRAQEYANDGLAVILIQDVSPRLSIIVPSQGDSGESEVFVAYAARENKNCDRLLQSDIKSNTYKVYVHY